MIVNPWTCTIIDLDREGRLVLRFDSDEQANLFLGTLQRRGVRVLGPDDKWPEEGEKK